MSPTTLEATAVSNDEFAAFVDATGHRTDAERLGVSAVFHLAVAAPRRDVTGRLPDLPWWVGVEGADWRHPGGAYSDLEGRGDHPVVHVSWADATAYAAWAGKRLPTETEWEHDARAGRVGARYPWGDERPPPGERMNVFVGDFPHADPATYRTTVPVDAYEPNDWGLYNTVGNVWEWCADWYVPGEQRALRGGSYLCHPSYCDRSRIEGRIGNTPDSAAANLGFRCAG